MINMKPIRKCLKLSNHKKTNISICLCIIHDKNLAFPAKMVNYFANSKLKASNTILKTLIIFEPYQTNKLLNRK